MNNSIGFNLNSKAKKKNTVKVRKSMIDPMVLGGFGTVDTF